MRHQDYAGQDGEASKVAVAYFAEAATKARPATTKQGLGDNINPEAGFGANRSEWCQEVV